jgi:hypothetical protein
MTENITPRQVEAAKILEGAIQGDRTAKLRLQEGIATSDLPTQLAPVINKIMLQNYAAQPKIWDMLAQKIVVDDFRPVQYMNMAYDDEGYDNAGDTFRVGSLPTVGEYDEYPTAGWFSFTEAEFKVKKAGSRIRFSWESIINDGNISILERLPIELARKAAGKEDEEVTKQLVATGGLNTTNFKTANQNLLTANSALGTAVNAPLSLEALEAAITQANLQTYNSRNAVPLSRFVLVVNAGLELTAKKILAIQQVRTETTSGSVVKSTITGNPLAASIEIVVNPWLKKINTSSDSYWFLLPVPSDTLNPGLVLGFLRGYETPELRVKANGGLYLGGGAVPAREGSFDNDDFEMRIRHIATGGFLLPTGTIASTGAGS